MSTCSEEEVNGDQEENDGSIWVQKNFWSYNNISKLVHMFLRLYVEFLIINLDGNIVANDLEVTTQRVLDHYNGDNNGLVSENLILLTPEEESNGVFR